MHQPCSITQPSQGYSHRRVCSCGSMVGAKKTVYEGMPYAVSSRFHKFSLSDARSCNQDFFAPKQISARQLAHHEANVCACDDRHWPFLPLAIPVRSDVSTVPRLSLELHISSCSCRMFAYCGTSRFRTYQSRGIGTAPAQAPSIVPKAAPNTPSMGADSARTSLQRAASTP